MSGITLYTTALKLKLKDKKALAVNLIFPIILTLIFVSVFSNLQTTKPVHVSVCIEEEGSSELLTNYKQFLEQVSDKGEVTIGIQSSNPETADFVIKVEEDKNQITFVRKSEDSQANQIMEQLTKSFADYRLLGSLGVMDMDTLISTRQLQEPMTMSTTMSIVVTMLGFVAMLGAQYGIGQVHQMRHPKGRRIEIAPINPIVWYLWEGLATWTMIFVQVMFLVIFFSFTFKLSFFEVMGEMILMGAVLALFGTALGIFLGAWIEGESLASSLLSMMVTLSCMLSGGFTPNLPPLPLNFLSPTKYVVDAIAGLTLHGNYTLMGQTMGWMLLVSAVLMGLAIMKLKREVN